jgi:hypothetical protein
MFLRLHARKAAVCPKLFFLAICFLPPALAWGLHAVGDNRIGRIGAFREVINLMQSLRTNFTNRLFLAAVVLLASRQVSAYGANVTLSWSPNSESDLAGYRLHYGTSSRNYSAVVNLGKVTNYTVTGLNAGTYYFALSAYDTSGNESGYSSEVSGQTLSSCDCNSDGLTNAGDVQVLVNAILAGNNASSYDINRNGAVDVLDLQVLSNVVLGVASCP